MLELGRWCLTKHTPLLQIYERLCSLAQGPALPSALSRSWRDLSSLTASKSPLSFHCQTLGVAGCSRGGQLRTFASSSSKSGLQVWFHTGCPRTESRGIEQLRRIHTVRQPFQAEIKSRVSAEHFRIPRCWHPWWRHRAYATEATQQDNSQGSVQQLVKLLVFGMLLGIGLRVAPSLGQHSVAHAIGLLEAGDPNWQRRGAERVASLAQASAAVEKLLESGIAHKLTSALANADSTDAGLMRALLQALAALAEHDAGREALVRAGAVEALQQKLQEGGEQLDGDEGAKEELAHLVVALAIQRDHVD